MSINLEEMEILTIEHNRLLDRIAYLTQKLQTEFELASVLLSRQTPYGPKYVVNLGMVHSVLASIEAAIGAGQIFKAGGDQQSAYLVQDRVVIKQEQREGQVQRWDPEQFIDKNRYATEISLTKGMLEPEFLEQLGQACKNIFTLKLESDHFEQRSQFEDTDLRLFARFSHISALELCESAITDSSLELIKQRLPNIKQIDLSGCYMVTDRGLRILSECQLVTIGLNRMSALKESAVVELIKASRNLNFLSVRQCPHITDTLFLRVYQVYRSSSSTLKWLQLSSDHGIDLFINKLSYLTSSNPIEEITDRELATLLGDNPDQYTGIFFDNCQELTKQSLNLIMDACKSLRKLCLSRFISLTDRLVQDLTLSLPQIYYLDLTSCVNITNNSLYYIATNLVGLAYLSLENCSSVSDEGLRHVLEKKSQSVAMTPGKGSQAKDGKQLVGKHSPRKNEANSERVRCSLRRLNLSHCNKITDESLNLIGQNAGNLQYLNLSGCDQITNQGLQFVTETLRNLEYLNLNNCEGLTDASISMVATRLGKRLQVLELQWCQVSQTCIGLITQNLGNLRVLNISYCPAVVSEEVELLARNMPHIQTLKLQSCSKIGEPAFIRLASLRELRVLCIKQCNEATDTFVKLLTTNNRHLEHLDVSWCTRLTDNSLFAVAKNCYSLRYLNLNGCYQVTDQGVQWLSASISPLEYLNLTLCNQITDTAVLELTNKMSSLRNLYLCELELLTDVSIATISNLQNLQQLVLTGCVGVTSSSLIGLLYNLEKLVELNINQCGAVEGRNLAKICQFMGNIKILEISEVQVTDEFLQQLSKHCQKLTHINLCYCNLISDEAVLTLIEGIPRLQRVEIQNTNLANRTKSAIFHALNARRMANIILQ